MSTGLLIVIIVIAILVIAALLFSMRGRMASRRHARQMQQRRDVAVGQHRQEAEVREERAEASERQARIAAAEAERERAQANLHQEQAGLHERGLADHEFVNEDGSLRDRDEVREEIGGSGDGRDTVEVDRQRAEQAGLVNERDAQDGQNAQRAPSETPRGRVG